jgi:M6 family metalloprotease-like protein
LTELDAFFREVSYGLAWIKADVTDRWYEIPIPLSKYDIQKWSFNQADMSDFRRNAITVADPDVNYQNYAYVIIVAAGKVWGNAAVSQSIVNNDSVSRFNIVVLNEQSQMGTYAHELGHLTPSEYRPRGGIGLPDLYSYEASEKDQPASVFVGPWCIMDVSKTPRHFCAWGKIMLGWITPEVVKPSVTQVSLFTIQPLEKDSGLRAVEVFLKSDRYYVIEVRMGKGYDRNLPGEGVLIYYVDESKRSGYGVVRVIDRNSLTKTLDDAAFRVGDKFEDDENSVYIAVVIQENSGFTVAISGSKILSLKDSDGDGLFDYVEERLGTDPRNPDTDSDGLTDREEVLKYGTDPLRSDTDGDGLADGDEIKYGTDPLQWDTDGDHWGDGLDVAPNNSLIPTIPLVAMIAAVLLVAAVRRTRRSMWAQHAPRFSGEVASSTQTLGIRMMGVKYCSECGFALSHGAKFCSKCGVKQSYYGDE